MRRLKTLISLLAPMATHRDLRNIAILNITLGMGMSLVSPFLSTFGTKEVGMSEAIYGLFMVVTTIAGVFWGTYLAQKSDRTLSRRTMTLLGGTMGAIGHIGYGFVRDVRGLLTIGVLILGVSGVTFSQLFAYAREQLQRSDLPQGTIPFYNNVFRMFFALSWTIGPGVAPSFLERWDYEGLFLAGAGCYLLFTLIASRVVLDYPPAPADTKAPHVPFRKFLSRRDIAAHFVAFVLVSSAHTINFANLPLYIQDPADLAGNLSHVGNAMRIAPFFELPFMIYFGVLATRYHPARIVRIGIGILIPYYTGLWLVRVPWQVYPLQILIAAATAVTSGVAISYFQNHLPNQPGAATNLYGNAMSIGRIVGYFGFAAIVGSWGHRNTYLATMLLISFSLALMMIRSHDEKDIEEPGPVDVSPPFPVRGA